MGGWSVQTQPGGQFVQSTDHAPALQTQRQEPVQEPGGGGVVAGRQVVVVPVPVVVVPDGQAPTQ